MIWNCDLMGKIFEHDPVKVVAAKWENCVTRTATKSANMTCVNGAGRQMPPMCIVKGTTISLIQKKSRSEAAGTFRKMVGWIIILGKDGSMTFSCSFVDQRGYSS